MDGMDAPWSQIVHLMHDAVRTYYSGVHNRWQMVGRCFLDIILLVNHDFDVPETSKASPDIVLKRKPNVTNLLTRGSTALTSHICMAGKYCKMSDVKLGRAGGVNLG